MLKARAVPLRVLFLIRMERRDTKLFVVLPDGRLVGALPFPALPLPAQLLALLDEGATLFFQCAALAQETGPRVEEVGLPVRA